MKNVFAVFLLLLSSYYSYAQNKDARNKFAVKLYNQTSWLRQQYDYQSTGGSIVTNKKFTFQLAHPTIALQLMNKRGNTHELEITQFSLGSEEEISDVYYPVSGQTIPMSYNESVKTDIALRYEYILNLIKKKKTRWTPAIGFAASTYIKRYTFFPGAGFNTIFPASSIYAGIQGWIIPRLNYSISSRLFIDVNVPLCIVDVNKQWNKQDNPNLTVDEQKRTITSIEGVPSLYSFRLGIGLRI